jgi:hypothetical protein
MPITITRPPGSGLIIVGATKPPTKIKAGFSRRDSGHFYEFTCMRSGCGWTCTLPKEGSAEPDVIEDRIVQINEHATTHGPPR